MSSHAPSARMPRRPDIHYMLKLATDFPQPEQRESQTYLMRYKTLLERALNLLVSNFTASIRKLCAETTEAMVQRSSTLTTTQHTFLNGLFQARLVEMTAIYEPLFRQAKMAFEPTHPSLRVHPKLPRKVTEETSRIAREVYNHMVQLVLEEFAAERSKLCLVDYENEVKDIRVKEQNRLAIHASTGDALTLVHTAQQYFQSLFERIELENMHYLKMWYRESALGKYRNMGSFDEFFTTKCPFHGYVDAMAEKLHVALRASFAAANVKELLTFRNWLRTMEEQYMGEEELQQRQHGELDSTVEFRLSHRTAAQAVQWVDLELLPKLNNLVSKDITSFIPSPAHLIYAEFATMSDPDPENGDPPPAYEAKTFVYPPVAAAMKILTMYHEADYREHTYEVIHESTKSILRAGVVMNRMTAPNGGPVNSQLFMIYQFLQLKDFIINKEVMSTRTQTVLELPDPRSTFKDLRSRGHIFSPTAYYGLLTSGVLLPRVMENILDARTELDGELRKAIMAFADVWAHRYMEVRSTVSGQNAIDVREEMRHAISKWFSEDGLVGSLLADAAKERSKQISALPGAERPDPSVRNLSHNHAEGYRTGGSHIQGSRTGGSRSGDSHARSFRGPAYREGWI